MENKEKKLNDINDSGCVKLILNTFVCKNKKKGVDFFFHKSEKRLSYYVIHTMINVQKILWNSFKDQTTTTK